MGNSCKSAPTAVSWGPNQMTVACTGDNDTAKTKSWNGNGWQPAGSAWDDLGGSFMNGTWF